MLESLLKNAPFIYMLMLFMHIVDDYYLQGILADLKQSKWWKEHYPDDLYKYDYVMALLCHSFSWSFLTMLPLVLYKYSDWWVVFVLINCATHMLVDDLKANDLKINLITDQAIHFIQINISLLLYIFIL